MPKKTTKSKEKSRSDAYKKGRKVRQELMGKKLADKLAKSVYTNPIMEKFADYASEAVFGLLWTRPGLDRKTRALICVISDTCTARWPELELHLKFARRQGWTEDELTETLLHLSGYIGVPSVREAMIIACDVFAEINKEGL